MHVYALTGDAREGRKAFSDMRSVVDRFHKNLFEGELTADRAARRTGPPRLVVVPDSPKDVASGR